MEEHKEVFTEDVKDILSKMPNKLIQFGTSIVFIVLLLMAIFSYLIEYPEVVEGDVIITTIEPAVKLSANQSKAIKKLYVENHSEVKEGEILIAFHGTTSLEEIELLKSIIELIEEDLHSKIMIGDYGLNRITIGEKQAQLSQLNKEITHFNDFRLFDESEDKIRLIRKRISFKLEFENLLETILVSVAERTDLEKKNFMIQKRLYEKEVISKAQFHTERISFLSKKEQIDEYKKVIIQNKIAIHDDRVAIENIINDEQLNLAGLQGDINKSLFILKSYQEEWYQNNTITATQNGQINFLKNFYSDEYVFAGDPLFSISSDEGVPIAYCYLPIQGYGRIKKNQKTRIKLNNYPYEEFGYLEGKVESVSQFPNEDLYLTVIRLDNGMRTNKNISLSLIGESRGMAEIVTQDLRLIDRLFFKLKKLKH